MSQFKEILIASLGMTPHVISEAFYFYAIQKPPRLFTQKYFLTTSDGRQVFQDKILRTGILNKLEHDLGLPAETLTVTDNDFFVFQDTRGKSYQDIRTTTASESEMETIFRVFSKVTSPPDTRITVLIAGGRKSMSVNLGLAMQLFGRQQDELIHLLAPPPYDNDPEWFYPRDPNDPAQQLDVIHIPYFRLNRYTQDLDLSKPLEALSITQQYLDLHAPIADCIFTGKTLCVNGQTFLISPAKLKYLRFHARRKLTHCTEPERNDCDGCSACYVSQGELIEEYFRGLEKEYGIMTRGTGAWNRYHENTRREREAFLPGGRRTIDIDHSLDRQIRQDRSRYNAILKKISPHAYIKDQLVITNVRRDDIRYYGIKLNKSTIQFQDKNGH